MGQHPQLDLGVVRVYEHTPLFCHEKAPHAAAELGAYWNILKVRLQGAYAPGAGLLLVEAGVDPPVRSYDRQKSLHIGGAQLCELAVFQYLVNDRVIGAQLLKDVRAGGVAALGLLFDREIELFKENHSKLLWGENVEFLTRKLIYEGLFFIYLLSELPAEGSYAVRVDFKARQLHFGEHLRQRKLYVIKYSVLAVPLKLLLEHRAEERKNGGPLKKLTVLIRVGKLKFRRTVEGAEAQNAVIVPGDVENIARKARVENEVFHPRAVVFRPAAEEFQILRALFAGGTQEF